MADLVGEPVLRRTTTAVCAAEFCETIIVVGADYDAVGATLQGLPCRVVHASDWMEGVSASIRVGIQALRHDAEGLFLFLGDMPLAPIGLCDELAELAKRSGYAARPFLDDFPGHPVAFVDTALPDLLALTGDEGAGSILRGIGPKLGYLPTTDEGAILDVDTPSDLARAERLWKSRLTSDMIDSAMSRGDLPRP